MYMAIYTNSWIFPYLAIYALIYVYNGNRIKE